MMTPDQPDQNTNSQPGDNHPQQAPGADQPQPDTAPEMGQKGKVIPFPTPAGEQAQPAPEVLEGHLVLTVVPDDDVGVAVRH